MSDIKEIRVSRAQYTATLNILNLIASGLDDDAEGEGQNGKLTVEKFLQDSGLSKILEFGLPAELVLRDSIQPGVKELYSEKELDVVVFQYEEKPLLQRLLKHVTPQPNVNA